MPYDLIWNIQTQADPTSLQRTAASIRAGVGNINATVGINTSGAQSGISKLTSGAQASTVALRQAQAQAQTLNATLTGTVRVTNDGAAAFRNFSEQAGLAARRFSAFTVAAGALLTAVRSIKEGVRAAVDFELAMNKVEQVSSETRSTLAVLRQDISGLATGLGVSSAALAESAITLKQAGLSANQTRAALETLALVDLAPAFDGQKQAAEGLIAALRQFQLNERDFKSTFSSLNAVAAEFAVESADIVTAIQKAGGAFKLSAGDMKGGTDALNEFVALFTSVRSTTRESADSIATGLRTVFTRFQRADTVKALQDLGVNLRYTKEEAEALGRVDLTQQFVGNFEAVKRLSEGLQGLRETDPRYSQVVEQLGGYRQISRVVPLLKEFQTAQEALNVAKAGQISLDVAAEKRQETLANKTAKLKEEYLDLFRKIVDSKAFQGLADSLLTVASGFAKVVDFARPLLPLMLAIATVKVGTNIGAIVGGFGRSFSASPGSQSGGSKQGVGVLRFAKGGFVSGSTSDQNVPQGTAETGEYIAAAKQKIFSPYAPLGPRKPLGPRANDSLIQAMEILTRPRKFASGGYVPGSGNNDSEAALLMPGEFVLNKGAVARLGVPALRDLNEGRGRLRLQKYANGSRNPVGGVNVDDLKAQTQGAIVKENAFQTEAKGLIATLSATPDLEGVAPVLAKLKAELKASEEAVALFTEKLNGLGTRIDQVAKDPAATTGSGAARIAAMRAKQAAVKPADVDISSPRPSANSEVHAIPEGPLRNAYFNNLPTVISSARAQRGGIDDAAFDDSVSEYYARRVTGGEIDFNASEKDLRSALRRVGRNAAASYKVRQPGSLTTDAEAPEAVENSPARSLGNDALQRLLAPVGGKIPGDNDYKGFQTLGASLGLKSVYGAKKGEIGPLVLKALQDRVRSEVEAAQSPSPADLVASVPTPSDDHRRRQDGAVPPGSSGGQPPLPPPPAPPAGGGAPEPDRSVTTRRQRANPREQAERSAASGLGLTVENYRSLYRTESGGERRVREKDFAAANQPEQTFQVQQGIFAGRKDGSFVPNGREEAARASAENARLAALAQSGRSLDANISARQSGSFGVGTRPGTSVSSDIIDRFNTARDFNPLNPLAGERELKGISGAEQQQAADRERVLGSLAAQRQSEEQKRADRDARRLKAQGDDSARRFREVPASLAAQRAREDAQEAALTERRTGGNFARLAVFGGSADDRQLLRQQRDAAGIGGITDPLQIKQAAIQAFRDGNGGFDVLDAVRDKLSPAQFAQVQATAAKAGFETFDSSKTQKIRQTSSAADLAQFQQNDDGSRTLTGGLLADRAQKSADSRIAARGGSKALSDSTQTLIREQAATDEMVKVRRELVSAQKNLLAKLQPELSSMERHIQAENDVAKAMAGLAQVAKDSSGRLLGLQSSVSLAQVKGIDAPGAGGLGYAAQSRLGNAAASAGEFLSNNRFTRLNDRLAGYTQGGFGARAFAGAGVATLVADGFDQRAGSAEDMVRRTNGAADYKTNKGIAGGLQGAVTGGVAGFAIAGPLGAAVGTVVGGAAGIYSALKDAASDIRQAKISNALTELSDKLSGFATGLPDSASLAAIQGTLNVYRENSNERANKESSNSLLYEYFTGDANDAGKFSESYRLNSRKELGPLLPQISQGLAKQAERLGRNSPDASLDKLLSDLRDGGQGVNREFIRLTAELRGVPVKQVEEEFRKALTSAQNAGRIDRQNRQARESNEQQSNAFGRLLLAVQAAADSLGGLQRQAAALSDVLDGTISASRVTSHESNLEGGFGRLDRAALKPLQLVADATGDSSLLKTGQAVDDVKRALLSVLPDVVNKRGVEGQDITSEVGDRLYRQLGFENSKSAPVEVQKVIASVLGGLNEAQDGGKGIGGIREQAGTDGTKFVDRLVAAAEEPLKEFGGKTARLLEENGNRLVDGLASINQRLQQVGQMYDQLAQTRTSNLRQELQFRADAAGRSSQALEGVPLSQLEGGLNARQQRLAGVNDARAFDPAFLGQQLTRTREQIGGAVERQQAAFEKPGGVKGGEFEAAANEVLRLKTTASNLQQALKNLADTSERSAVLQEKLNRLKQEEDGRLGLAERFATADPAEQQRLNRSVVLTNEAANKGSLDGFGNEDRRQILDFLNSARGVTLTGLKGSPRAEDLKNNLLANSFGGQFQLNRDQKAENTAVRGAIVDRNKTGEAALGELIKFQESGTKDLLSGLKAQQNEFFARLERLLLANKAADVQNRITSVEAQKGALADKGAGRDLLAELGITKTSQVEILGKSTGKIEALRGAIATEQSERDKIDAAREAIKGVAPSDDRNRFLAPISRSGLKAEQVNRVQNRADALFEYDESFQAKLANVNANTARGSAQRNEGYNDVRRQAYERALQEEKAKDISKPVQEARSKLSGIEGVDPLKIEETLRDPKKGDAFLKALGSFDNGSNKIEDFGKKVEAANAELDKLKAQLAEINATSKAASGTVTRAQGGSIFRPMGTDTVPAMLTPGEFVINARSASANSALLQRINAARGPVAYRAGGGFVGPLPETIAEETMREIEERRIASEKFVLDRNIQGLFGAAGAIAGEAKKGDPAEAQARQLLNFAARQNPFGRSAQALAEKRGGSNAAGRLAVTAQAINFNRLSSLGSGIRRPGDDGQLAIASRVIGVEQKGLEDRFANDPALRKFVGEQFAPKKKVRKFANGGYVGHAGVGDTVPALLTGGEFVLNQAAVARAGAHNVQRFNDGGPVGGNFVAPGAAAVNREQSRRQEAGLSEATVNRLSSSLSTFAQQVGGFSESAEQLSRTLNAFAGSARDLTQALNNMPRTLTGQFTHNVVVTHNGAEVFSKLTPAIEQMVAERVNSAMTRVFKEHLPDAGVSLN